MVVGVYRIALMLPQVKSLKAKRSVVRKVLERTRARFNVTAAEVGFLDEYRRALLGFAVASNDRRHANAMLDAIAQAVDGIGSAVVSQRSMELIQMGEMDMVIPAADGRLHRADRWNDDEPDDRDAAPTAEDRLPDTEGSGAVNPGPSRSDRR